MPLDAYKNLSLAKIATAPSPATTGTTLTFVAGQGAWLPIPPFNATVWDGRSFPVPTNAEIVRVTEMFGDTAVIEREQEGTTARAILVNDLLGATFTEKFVNDLLQLIAEKAPLDSPDFFGIPTAPTAAPGTSTTQIASTEFVTEAVALVPAGPQGPPGGSTSVFFYRVSTTSTGANDPGSGKYKYNTTSQWAATSLYFDWVTEDGFDAHLFFQMLHVPSRFVIQDADFALNYQVWEMTAPATQYADWFEVHATLVEFSDPGVFSNNTKVAVLLLAEGPPGPAGPPGDSTSFMLPYLVDVSSTDAADPGAGFVRYGADPQGESFSLYISGETAVGDDVLALFALFGYPSFIQIHDGATNYQEWQVIAPVVMHTGWCELPVYLHASTGSATFVQDQPVTVLLLYQATTPPPHAGSHMAGQSDALAISTLAGYPHVATAFLNGNGTFTTPETLAHAITHGPGGSDPLQVIDADIILVGTLPDARLSANVQMKPVAESDVTNLVTDLAAKAPINSTFLTGSPESALTNARQLIAGANVTFDTSVAGRLGISAAASLAIGEDIVGGTPNTILINDATGKLANTNSPTVKRIFSGTNIFAFEGFDGVFILRQGREFAGTDTGGNIATLMVIDGGNNLQFRHNFTSGSQIVGIANAANTQGEFIVYLANAPALFFTPPAGGSGGRIQGFSLANGYTYHPWAVGYLEISAAYTQTDTDVVINCTSGTFVLTLLTVASRLGRVLVVRNSGAGTITLTPVGGDTSEITTVPAGATVWLQAKSTGWISIGTTGFLPTTHHATHETGGSDALTVLSASILTTGTLPDARLSSNVQMKPVAESDVTNLVTDLAAKAPLASPALTGTPTAPTAAAATSTTQLATTKFVSDAIALVPAGPAGPQGDPGPAGGILQDQWVWNAAVVSSTLAAGRVGLNHDTPSLATQMWIHRLSNNSAGVDWTVVISSMVVGDKIYFQRKTDSSIYGRYTLTGVPTLSGGTTWVIPVVFTSGNSEPPNGVDSVVAFQRMSEFPDHHASHDTGGSDALTALSASILTSGLLPDARLSPAVRPPTEQSTSATGTQNNFSLTNGHVTLRCTNTSALEITGFSNAGSGPVAGDRVTVLNVGTSTVRVGHQETTSTAGNRCVFSSIRGQILGINGSMELVYDGSSSRWRVKDVNPGLAIPIPFNAADFSSYAANGATWTVTAGNVGTERYLQYGTELHLYLTVSASALDVGTGAIFVQFKLPNGFTGVNNGVQLVLYGRYGDGSGLFYPSAVVFSPGYSTTDILITSMNNAAFVSTVSNFTAQGACMFLVD